MLDTHIVAALYDGRTAGLSRRTLQAIDRQPVSMSPAVMLELEWLHEIGRLRIGGAEVARHMDGQLGIRVARDRFLDVTSAALSFACTRDPFDRLIVAHAALLNAALVTHDVMLAQQYSAVLQ